MNYFFRELEGNTVVLRFVVLLSSVWKLVINTNITRCALALSCSWLMLDSPTLWRNWNRSVLCFLSFLPYWFYFCFLGLLLTWGMAFIIKSVMTPIVSALIIGLLVRIVQYDCKEQVSLPRYTGLSFRPQTTWKFVGKLVPDFFHDLYTQNFP